MPIAPHNPDRKIASFLLLVCIFFITAGYYLFHKPITPGVALALGTAVWRIVVVFMIVSLAGAAGRKVGIFLDGFALSTAVLQVGLGLGLISVLVLLVGSSIGINWISLAVLPAIAIIALWKPLVSWILLFTAALSNIWQQTGRFERIIAFFIGIILLSTLVVSLAPPLQYDALMYHLVMPQQYVTQGKITHIPWLVMTGMPQTTEMLFTLAIGWGGLQAAAVMGWTIGLLAILGIIGFFQNNVSRLSCAGWVAAACLLAGETFASSLSWAYVDWTSLLFGISALTALNAWINTPSTRYIFLAGLFAGLSFATKYTGGILVLCSLIVVLYHLISQKNETGRTKIQWLLYFSTAACAFPGVWLLRNLLLTGNPIYPFFLPAAEMDATRISVYQGAGAFGEWWEGFVLPIRATIWGNEASNGYSVSIGPLLLALALCNLVRKSYESLNEKNALKLSIVMVLSGWLFWAVGNRLSGYLIQTRMYYSIFPALAVLAALGWKTVSAIQFSGIRFSRVVGALVLLGLGLSTLNVLVETIQTDAIRVVIGAKSESDYLDATLGWYAPTMRSVQSLPAGARTLFLYEPRGLACVPSCDPDEILDRWKISRMDNSNPKSVINLWKQQGFDYVLLHLQGMKYLEEGTDPHHPPEEVRALREVVKDLPVIGTYGQSYQLYKLQ
jgi:hypothetical protein